MSGNNNYVVTAKNFLAADKYWYIYIYKISRWSYSILSKVFIWIQSSKINGSRMQRFVTIESCLVLTDFYQNFDAHIPVNKHFSYDLQKISTPSPSQEKASVPISWIFYYSTEYECLFHKNGQTASHISGLNYHIEIQ